MGGGPLFSETAGQIVLFQVAALALPGLGGHVAGAIPALWYVYLRSATYGTHETNHPSRDE